MVHQSKVQSTLQSTTIGFSVRLSGKNLYQVMHQCGGKSPDLLLKAISELHRIEMSLHTLFEEIPGDVRIEESKTKDEGRL